MTLPLEITWIGGNCPVQAEGIIDGKEFYFRGRGDRWSISVGDPITDGVTWDYSEEYRYSGWMSETEARRLIEESAGLYMNRNGRGW